MHRLVQEEPKFGGRHREERKNERYVLLGKAFQNYCNISHKLFTLVSRQHSYIIRLHPAIISSVVSSFLSSSVAAHKFIRPSSN